MKYLHLCLHTLRADCNGLSIVRMKLKCTFASTRSVQIATVKSIGNRLHTIFASTRSVQIATRQELEEMIKIAALPPHAPCRLQPDLRFGGGSAPGALPPHAPCRLQRIPTCNTDKKERLLCLHTLRADCNTSAAECAIIYLSLPPHAPCRLQHRVSPLTSDCHSLCLHTLRADCNFIKYNNFNVMSSLPPHAPCRLQRYLPTHFGKSHTLPPHAPCRLQQQFLSVRVVTSDFASTRSVQIATAHAANGVLSVKALPPHAPCRLQHHGRYLQQVQKFLCLHTLRADCNGLARNLRGVSCHLCLHTLRADCNGRNAQNCNMHFSERVLSW